MQGLSTAAELKTFPATCFLMLALVKTAVEEIAWEGPPGISWGDLVQRLTQHGFGMDKYNKEALWTELTCKPPAFVRSKKKAHDPKEREDVDKVLDLPDAVRQHYLLLDAHPRFGRERFVQTCTSTGGKGSGQWMFGRIIGIVVGGVVQGSVLSIGRFEDSGAFGGSRRPFTEG